MVSGLLLFFTPVAQIFCCALQYYWSKFLLFFALHNVNLRFPAVLLSNSSCSFFDRQEFYLPRSISVKTQYLGSSFVSHLDLIDFSFCPSDFFSLANVWYVQHGVFAKPFRSAWRFCQTFSFSMALLQNFFVQHGVFAKLFRSAWRFCKTLHLFNCLRIFVNNKKMIKTQLFKKKTLIAYHLNVRTEILFLDAIAIKIHS